MSPERLAVVIPVYNEAAIVGEVLRNWADVLRDLDIDFTIYAYNDGSKDGTAAVLDAVSAESPRVVAIHKGNEGHGPTILRGYREQSRPEAGFAWIFQTDSDNELPAASFGEFWRRRADHDFLLGRREGRGQVFARRVVSLLSRLTTHALYGRGVWDVNSPYRLMRVGAFRELFMRIPADTFAPNVIVSGCAALYRLRTLELPVPFSERATGEGSLKKRQLLTKSARAFWQTIRFRPHARQ